MQVALTGGTGFLGRYILTHLLEEGGRCRAWHRASSDRTGLTAIPDLIWVPGDLTDPASMASLVDGCDAVVHAAFDRPGAGFRGAEGDVPTFVERNVVGTLRLIEASRQAGVERFVFVSTCAVHEKILDDRALDEAHPLWATTHYGAHKAAIEKFVHSYGYGEGFAVCALRPTGIYGVARPVESSKWYELIQSVGRGENVASDRGGKEVHAADVARAIGLLLRAPTDQIRGESFNCYDMYVAQQDVAEIARELSGSGSSIERLNRGPKHQIDTTKIRALGMTFGGEALLRATVRELL
ncbi:MAG: NAD-dependent epimerase/dehydratase family protein [Phycisphaerae bacterium]